MPFLKLSLMVTMLYKKYRSRIIQHNIKDFDTWKVLASTCTTGIFALWEEQKANNDSKIISQTCRGPTWVQVKCFQIMEYRI